MQAHRTFFLHPHKTFKISSFNSPAQPSHASLPTNLYRGRPGSPHNHPSQPPLPIQFGSCRIPDAYPPPIIRLLNAVFPDARIIQSYHCFMAFLDLRLNSLVRGTELSTHVYRNPHRHKPMSTLDLSAGYPSTASKIHELSDEKEMFPPSWAILPSSRKEYISCVSQLQSPPISPLMLASSLPQANLYT
jgi:hypothetical protein